MNADLRETDIRVERPGQDIEGTSTRKRFGMQL